MLFLLVKYAMLILQLNVTQVDWIRLKSLVRKGGSVDFANAGALLEDFLENLPMGCCGSAVGMGLYAT